MSLPSVTSLVQRRKALRLSQKELAKIIHVHSGSISNWERGEFKSLRMRVLVSHVLDAIESNRPIADPEIRDLVLEGK